MVSGRPAASSEETFLIHYFDSMIILPRAYNAVGDNANMYYAEA